MTVNPGSRYRALTFDPGTGFHMDTIDRAPLQPGFVRLTVDACGVCGSDRQVVNGESVPPGTVFPLVMGHEVAGTIIELGEGVDHWQIGDAVVVHPFVNCGVCAPCQRQQPNLCVRQTCIGYHSMGGFAEEVTVRANQLIARPAGCPPEAAALLVDAYATPYHAIRLSGLMQMERPCVLVIGTGGLGLAAIALLSALRIDAVGVATRRSAGAPTPESLGVQTVISMADDARTVARTLRRWSPATGIDVVLDTVATADSIALGLDVVRYGGSVLLVGMSEENASLPIAKTVRRGIRVLASYGSTLEDLNEVVELVGSGRLEPSRLIGQTLPLGRAEAAFGSDRQSGRTVIQPNLP